MDQLSRFVTGRETGHEKQGVWTPVRNEAPKTMPERIEALINRTSLNYSDLAIAMGVTRTTVHDVRKGQRQPTKKFIAKFDLAEKQIEEARRGETGVLTRRGESLITFAMSVGTIEDDLMNPPEFVCVNQLPTEAVPEPDGIPILLERPTKARGIGGLIQALTHEKCDEFILIFLPERSKSQQFIESLTPQSYLKLLKRCGGLILGPKATKQLQMLADEVESRRKDLLETLDIKNEAAATKASP